MGGSAKPNYKTAFCICFCARLSLSFNKIWAARQNPITKLRFAFASALAFRYLCNFIQFKQESAVIR